MLRAMVRLHAASRPFPIFSAAAPLAPADPMLPGSLFCLRPYRGPGPQRGPRKRNISATAGMDRAGGSKLRGLQGIISTTKRGLRDGARRVPDSGSQSAHLDRRVPCRVCGFRRFQSNRPIASAYGVVCVRIYTMPVREFFGADLPVLVVLSTAVTGLAALSAAILWNR